MLSFVDIILSSQADYFKTRITGLEAQLNVRSNENKILRTQLQNLETRLRQGQKDGPASMLPSKPVSPSEICLISILGGF